MLDFAMFDVETSDAYKDRQKSHNSFATLLCNHPFFPWPESNMADKQSVKCALNDVISRLDRLENPAEIGAIVLRLDYINRMIVNLDLEDDIVNTMCKLHDTVANIELKYCRRTQVADAGYQARLKNTGGRGRPAFDIPNEQLLFLLEQGFGVPDISTMLGVGQRTVQRRMAQYGFTVAGKTSQCSYVLLLLVSLFHKE